MCLTVPVPYCEKIYLRGYECTFVRMEVLKGTTLVIISELSYCCNTRTVQYYGTSTDSLPYEILVRT